MEELKPLTSKQEDEERILETAIALNMTLEEIDEVIIKMNE